MLSLVDSKSGLAIEIVIPVHLGDALRRQLFACQERSAGDFGDRLGPLLGKAMVLAMDAECKPPTEREIRQAALISAKSGTPVPQEAWSSQVQLRAFVETSSATVARGERQ